MNLETPQTHIKLAEAEFDLDARVVFRGNCMEHNSLRLLFPTGAHVVARGPRSLQGKPDIDGVVTVFEEKNNLVLVQEAGWKTPTPVNPWSGWMTLTVNEKETRGCTA